MHEPTPEAPWKLIWYFDEIGISPLTQNDPRKTLASYWSFLEFGPQVLCKENAWFVMCVVRTQLLKRLPGKWSHMNKLQLRKFFDNAMGNFRDGMVLHIPGMNSPKMFFAELYMVCGDLDALFHLLHKRQNSIVPCPLHANLVSCESGLAEVNNWFVACDCTDTAKMIPHTTDSIKALLVSLQQKARDVEAKRMTKGDFEEYQKRIGWNHGEYNILFDDLINLNVEKMLHMDWFHTFAQTGIFNYTVFYLFTYLRVAKPHIDWWDKARACAEKFTWPRSCPKCAHLIDKENLSTDNCYFKCSGSEALSLYPVVAYFIQKGRPAGICDLQANSFIALCDLLDLLVHSREGIVSAMTLKQATTRWASSHKAAYGSIGWVFKMHVPFHIAEQLALHNVLISLFTHERRHKLPKKYIHDRRPSPAFERGLIEEVTLQHIHDMKQPWSHDFEVPRQPTQAMINIVHAFNPRGQKLQVFTKGALVYGMTVHAGDCVAMLHNNIHKMGELWFLASIDVDGIVQYLACVSEWRPLDAFEYAIAPTGSIMPSAPTGSIRHPGSPIAPTGSIRHPSGSLDCRDFVKQDCPRVVLLENVVGSIIYGTASDNKTVSCLVPAPLRRAFCR